MQQTETLRGLVPVLSSQAGSCLTYENWLEADVSMVSYHLADLLMKPGLAFLKELDTLRDFIKWPGTLILNAASLSASPQGDYVLRSTYDGSLIRLDRSTLMTLIHKLQADRVILPKGSTPDLNKLMSNASAHQVFYIHHSEAMAVECSAMGHYILQEDAVIAEVVKTGITASNKPVYMQGAFTLAEMKQLSAGKRLLFESDEPASNGMQGLVYHDRGVLAILDPSQSENHQPIDRSCQCNTCFAQLTVAYLHHLLQQTPLLAQRYLIQHNVYYCRNHLAHV